MAKKQKLSRDEQEKAEMEKMQKRVENLLPPKAEIPAPISIQQAEELKARIQELEAELEENRARHQSSVAASEPAPLTNAARSFVSKNTANKKLMQEYGTVPSETSTLSDPQRRRNMGLLSGFLAGVGFLGSIFYVIIYLQTSVWQILAEAGFILLAIGVLAGVAYPLIKRNKFREGSTWVMVGISIAFAAPELVWENATTQLLVTGMLLLFVLGTTYPPQPMAWLIVPALYIVYMFVANLLKPFTRFDINQSPIVNIFISSITAVIGIWVIWQLYTLILRYSREESASIRDQKQTSSERKQPFRFGKSPFWRALSRLLVEPDDTVVGVEPRRQAQLLTTSLAVLIPLYILGQFFRTPGPDSIEPLIGSAIALALIAAYGLSRTKRFQVGSLLTVAALTASIYTSFLNKSGQFTDSQVLNIIIWLMLPLVISSIILPVRSMVFFLLGNVAIMIALAFVPAIPKGPIFASTSMVIIVSILLYVSRWFRERIEQENQARLIVVNEELETSQRIAQSLNQNLFLAAEVSKRLSQVRDLASMLTESTELIRTNFNLYYVQVYLTNQKQTTLLLQAGTGSVGAELLRRGHRLSLDASSINGRAAFENRAIIVSDTTESLFFRTNPLLPETRSEMAVPLMVGDKVVGVLDLQSQEPGYLNQDVLPAFEALAGQMAIAIQNATLYAQSEEARKQVEANARQITTVGWQDFLNGTDRGEKIGYIFDQTEVRPLERKNKAKSDNALSIPITVTGATVGTIQVAQDEREWTASESLIVQSTAAQLAQHIENLRLLSQAEKYRQEAEQTTRRLTREDWEGYLQTRNALATGYSFDPNEVKLENEVFEIESSSTLSLPITVRDEAIGELMINTANVESDTVNEIFSAVAAQLGDHIESLRLLETTQNELVERTRAEKELLRVRLGMDRANDAVFITEIDGTIIYVNPAFERIYGWTAKEAIGQTPRILKSGVIPAEQYAHFWGALKSNQVVAGEIVNKTKDGRLIPIEGNNNPIVDSEGTIIGFLGMHRDITDRKKAQEIIAQRAIQLETVATVSSTAATVLDPDKLLQAVVDLTKERFNVYHTHIYLADESWNTLLLAAGAGEVGRQMVNTGHAIQMDTERSLVARASRERKSIIVNDVRSEAGYLPNPMLPETRSEMAIPMIAGDKVIGVFDVQAEDVDHFTDEDANIYTTLASQVAVALQNARLYVEQAATVTQLRELDRLKSSFLANMSHELRTPLNSILGFADVMLEGLDGPLTDNMNNDLGLIQKNGQHLLHLINDVLDMAKIDSGKMNLHVEKFNIHELLTDVTSITSSLAKEKSLDLIIEPDSDHKVEINADKIRLRQVMINLVNNAMKFTDKGTISLRARREDKNVFISVKDTGIGISLDHLESVFQEFTQVDTTTTRKAGGTGLGLPISRRLINMHSGRLWAESTGINGEGSTFYVTLPIEANINENATLTAN